MSAKVGVVRVKVKKSGLAYTVESNHPLPDIMTIKRHLPSSLRVHLPYGHTTIQSAITNSISHIKPQVWADAIARATHDILQTPTEAVAELVSNQTGFVQLGNRIYKLQMVDTLTTPQRALPVLRRAVMDDARNEAVGIREAADKYRADQEQAARNNVFTIQQELAAAKSELANIKSEMAIIPPQWAIEYHVPWKTSRYGVASVGMQLTFTVDSFVYGKKMWRSVNPKPVRTFVWVYLNTTTPHNLCVSVYLEEGFPNLPHINQWGACQQMADAPVAITNYRQYEAFKASVLRSVSVVNLGSLVSGFLQWPQEIHDCLPPALAALVKDGDFNDSALKRLPDDSPGSAATFTIPEPQQPLDTVEAAQTAAAEGTAPLTAVAVVEEEAEEEEEEEETTEDADEY